MKRNILVSAMIVLMLAPFIMLNCSRDDVAVVRIQLKNVPQTAAMNSNPNSILERVFRWFVPNAYASFPGPWANAWDEIQIIISAPDLEDISFALPPTETELVLEIPAGPARKITAYGVNVAGSFGINWGGNVELDLNPGDEVDVQIDMLPRTKPFDIMRLVNDVQVRWNPLSTPTYGVLGYNIYRSDYYPEGPYYFVGSVAGASSDTFVDATGGFIDGEYYYYKISVFTDSSEGELSDNIDLYYFPS